MQYYAVIDTNVLVSALLAKSDDSPTVQVLNELFRGTIIPVFNTEIIQEYTDVLHRPKFGFSDINIQLLLQSIIDNGIFVERMPAEEILPDPKDLVFYEVVLAKRDDHAMLVTGNMKHFPTKPFIVTPHEIIEIIKNDQIV